MLEEAKSTTRYFLSQLVPSHGGKEKDQLKNFLDLIDMSNYQPEELWSKFRLYDAKADASFMDWFGKISNLSFKANRVFHSLSFSPLDILTITLPIFCINLSFLPYTMAWVVIFYNTCIIIRICS